MLVEDVCGVIFDEGEADEEATDNKPHWYINQENEGVELVFIFSKTVKNINSKSVYQVAS